MIKTIRNISRSQFKKINHRELSEYPSQNTNAYISIRGSEADEIKPPRINHSLWYKGIMLIFDDVDKVDFRDLHPISQDQCEQIIRFVQTLLTDERELNLIIHCYAGISRSAAVAKWVNDTFKLDLHNYSNNMMYNCFVYKQLQICWERLNTDEQV